LLFGCSEREVEVGGESPDISAPDRPTDFKSFAHPDRVELSWQNPENDDFAGVLLVRSEAEAIEFPEWRRSYDAGDVLGDGVVAYVGEDEEFVDYDITCGKAYRYYLFAFDDSYGYSEDAELEALPGGMVVPRIAFAATTLADGRVLITGGISYGGPTDSAEIFDPATGVFSLVSARMSTSRFDHTATLLADGRVLIVGGFKEGLSEALSTAEVFDPSSERFTKLTSSLAAARADHGAAVLADGRVLVAGGTDGVAPIASAELYDPESGGFSELASSLSVARMGFTLTPFTKDDEEFLLIAGGVGPEGFALDTAEVFSFDRMRFEGTDGQAGGADRMNCAHAVHRAVGLDGSRVLIVGGSQGDEVTGQPTACTEIFDPSADEPFARMADLATARSGFAIAALADSRVFICGGVGEWLEILGTGEMFDPAGGAWTPAGTMIIPRTVPHAIALDSGDVLVVGGNASDNFFSPEPLATPELFDPDSLTFALFVSCSQ